MELLISIITGLLSGGGIGEAAKKLSLGKMGNLITGGLGGLLGGLGEKSGSLGDLLGQMSGEPTGAAAAGVAGGGILMTIVGFIKNVILKK